MIAPPLKPGGTIGMCSPSSLVDEEYLRTVLEPAVRRQGFILRPAKNIFARTHGYLASPEERGADLNELVADEQVGLILFGGGEGSNELLPYIDFDAIKSAPRRISSYSDGTTILNAIWARTGLETYYGWTPHLFEDLRLYDYRNFQNMLMRDKAVRHEHNSEWVTLHGGKASGVLVGGYSRNFAMLLGSAYFPIDLNQSYVLFLEDHASFGNVDYISAMLTHIEQHPFIDSVTGLLFGHYSKPRSQQLLERLERFGQAHNIPVVYCDDFGHGVNHAILPIGHTAELDADAQELIYL